MKVKELGKAIAEFELNNIPAFIKGLAGLILFLILWGVYLVAKLLTKFWYVPIPLILGVMHAEHMVYFGYVERAERLDESFLDMGLIGIDFEGIGALVLYFFSYVILVKLVKFLSPLIK